MIEVECEPDLQEDLYHYTDFVALKGIYEDGKLWATNSQYLNDISEMQLGPKVVMGVVVPLLPIGPEGSQMPSPVELEIMNRALTKEQWDAVRRVAVEAAAPILKMTKDWDLPKELQEFKELKEACEHAMKDTTCFVSCLSKQPDQLSQWRAYAKDGVCIHFSAETLCKSLGDAPASRARMWSVRYYDENAIVEEQAKLEDYVRTIIVDLVGELRAKLIANGVDEAARKVRIGQELVTRLAFVKDTHFEEEGEVRIAVQGNPNHFTTPSPYGIVPRMKLPITPDAIKSVIVGPSAHAELRVQSLQTYFDNVKFKNDPDSRGKIEVKPSTVPYRDW